MGYVIEAYARWASTDGLPRTLVTGLGLGRDTDDALNFGNIRVSSRVNSQEIIVDESMLNELFGLLNKGCVVKKEKGVIDLYDEKDNKVTLDIKEIKKIPPIKATVVTVEANLLEQNDLESFGR